MLYVKQLDRKSMIIDDMNSTKIFRVRLMADGTLKGVPMSKVSIQQFIDDSRTTDTIAYVEIDCAERN